MTAQDLPAPVLCSDCPPVGYPTDKTRCLPCPRRHTEGGDGKEDGTGSASLRVVPLQSPSDALLEAVKRAVRDEAGSKLCGWTNHKGRVCTGTYLTAGCVCEQVAAAAIAAYALEGVASVSPEPRSGVGTASPEAMELLSGFLRCAEIADCAPEDKDPETTDLERRARALLSYPSQREEVLEEAAKVAHDFGEEDRPTDQKVAAAHIEDRIRALKSPSPMGEGD